MRTLMFVLLALGVIGVLISLPLLGLAALGYYGILADMGPVENREIGMQFLFLGLPPLIGGVILCALGVVALFGSHRHGDGEADSAADGRE